MFRDFSSNPHSLKNVNVNAIYPTRNATSKLLWFFFP